MQFANSNTASSCVSSSSNRLHGLDTLRGIAAVLVVLLHSGIPYMTHPLSYLVWPARDAHPCIAVDGLTWCAECFLMPLFFVLGGFFSQGLLVSRGERSFLVGRTRRLLFTQLLGLAILPVCLGIWSLGWIADGIYVPLDLMNGGLPPEIESDLYGQSHFWFLQNLYIYCLVLCGGHWLKRRICGTGRIETDGRTAPFCRVNHLMASVWKPIIPAIPTALILYYDPRIVLGFYQTFLPVLSKLFYYAIYFFVGTTLYRHRESLHQHARFGKLHLMVAGALFAAILPLIHEHSGVALVGLRLALLAGLLSLFAWFATFGLIAVFLRGDHRTTAATRYLAEASFWIYLIHLPFVGLAQIAIAQFPIPAIGKFLFSGTIALSMSLLTYHVFVREKWIGQFLDGRRKKPPISAVGLPVMKGRSGSTGLGTARLNIGHCATRGPSKLWKVKSRPNPRRLVAVDRRTTN